MGTLRHRGPKGLALGPTDKSPRKTCPQAAGPPGPGSGAQRLSSLKINIIEKTLAPTRPMSEFSAPSFYHSRPVPGLPSLSPDIPNPACARMTLPQSRWCGRGPAVQCTRWRGGQRAQTCPIRALICLLPSEHVGKESARFPGRVKKKFKSQVWASP